MMVADDQDIGYCYADSAATVVSQWLFMQRIKAIEWTTFRKTDGLFNTDWFVFAQW